MKRSVTILILASLVTALLATVAFATEPLAIPTVSVGIGKATKPGDMSSVLQIFFLMTVLSLAPGLLIMCTSFTRIVIVLSFLRGAMGIQQAPSNQIIIGLSLFMTFFIMAPVWQQVNTQALQPYKAQTISQEIAFDRAIAPVRQFMFSQTREKDIALFVNISKLPRPNSANDVPTMTLIPSFIISELRTAFQMGFLIYIPFIVIDMVVASVLMSMGMMMLPPMMISLPFKLLLFVLVDGWTLVLTSLVKSFA